MADYTLMISNLINTKYGGGDEDIIEHIAKMKCFRHDLVLMGHDIEDEIFACFLRLSMPQDWNYVFAGLMDPYMSKDVETHIKGEHSSHAVQTASASAFRTASSSKPKGKGKKKGNDKSNQKANEPYCNNCNRPGHWTKSCWSKGGGAEGQGPKWKGKKPNKGKANKA